MPSNDLTLAVSLRALDELARPSRALEDAARWTCHLGIVSSEPSFIERRRVREAGYEQEFLSGPRTIEEALTSVRAHFDTARYVFVGTDETSEVVTRVPDWTYQSVTDAAAAADWRLTSTIDADEEWPYREKTRFE
ncbi:uncharacterized protein HfgLR_24375 (plasmid) [Haloferax gibbonsii]|uniref:DUF7124 domain-containing protein n=1 Tax=Haloferax gibbonsii TaxID=35746 RepID=A0A871BMT4_HALGI|nr:hypothetical protein [Haloferax gibbonsii]QOS14059.1 uncharacterized protein HfgLR_24375 [Haloferax gibbonsii]